MNQEVKQWIDMAEMDYGVAVRYPSELFLEERHASEALKMTKEIIDWGKCVIASQNEI